MNRVLDGLSVGGNLHLSVGLAFSVANPIDTVAPAAAFIRLPISALRLRCSIRKQTASGLTRDAFVTADCGAQCRRHAHCGPELRTCINADGTRGRADRRQKSFPPG